MKRRKKKVTRLLALGLIQSVQPAQTRQRESNTASVTSTSKHFSEVFYKCLDLSYYLSFPMGEEDFVPVYDGDVSFKGLPCPFCTEQVLRRRRYIVNTHLPYYVTSFTVSLLCRCLELRQVRLVKDFSDHHTADQKHLFNNYNLALWAHLVCGLLHHGIVGLNAEDAMLIKIFDCIMGSATPEIRTIPPPPTPFLTCCSRELWHLCAAIYLNQEQFRIFFCPRDGIRTQHLPHLPVVKEVGSHFHFDRLLIRTGYPDISFALAAALTGLQGVELDKVLAIYCFSVQLAKICRTSSDRLR